MKSLLLLIIYLSFISLGLPDTLLGAAWPVMRFELGVPLSGAGLLAMIVTAGTILSSFFSGRLIQRMGTGKLTLCSVLLTAMALLGYGFAGSFVWLVLMAVPLGLGAGAVDAGLNNHVALHYKARHMNWLHSFWGVGATLGPLLMAFHLTRASGWQGGYRTIALLQFLLVGLLFLSLPLWRKQEEGQGRQQVEVVALSRRRWSFKEVLTLSGMKVALAAFFCYSSLEMATGLWGSSFLVSVKGLSPEQAARWLSFYYGGITLGRMLSGFATWGISNGKLIRGGAVVALIGVLTLLLPLPAAFSMPGLILIGLGCAPIFPSMLHETPRRFGKDASEMVMGIQMAFAYTGGTLMPPLLGVLAMRAGLKIFPWFLLLLVLSLLGFSELLRHSLEKRRRIG